MSSSNLKNLEKIGQLKHEPFDQEEYNGLIRSGSLRLKDANNKSLSQESRFDLAYNAAHSLALAALRKADYRSINRYIVFQALPHTLGLEVQYSRILDVCHNQRNIAEYEGYWDVSEKLLDELLDVTQLILEKLKK